MAAIGVSNRQAGLRKIAPIDKNLPLDPPHRIADISDGRGLKGSPAPPNRTRSPTSPSITVPDYSRLICGKTYGTGERETITEIAKTIVRRRAD